MPHPPIPPRALRRPKVTAIHGRRLVDDYAWLRGRDEVEVRAYLTAEDEYAEAVMAPLAGLQEALYQEMLSHILETDTSVPYREGDAWYYVRTEAGRQYPIFCRRSTAPDAPEEVLLDQNALAAGHPFLSIGALVVSDDGAHLAYSVDETGYRQYTLFIKDLRTGALWPERFERVTSFAWARDGRTLLFVTEDPLTKRSDSLHRHELGTSSTALVYHEPDALFDIAVSRSLDRELLFLDIFSKTSTETRFVAAGTPAADWRVIVPREPLHEYDVAHRGGEFYLRTNRHAHNFRVVRAPVDAPGEANWIEVVPHREHVKIESLDLFARHAALLSWEHGLEHLEIVDLLTGTRRRVPQPEPVYGLSLGPNRAFDTTRLRFTYQSLAVPPSVLEADMDTLETARLKDTVVPGGFDRTRYVTERTWATAPDGTRVPISLVSRRETPRDGTAPLLLYAYGSYGLSIPPDFSASRLPLLDRGMIYAIAHIRGGGELGEAWREQGRMLQKLNTFTDFVACAEHLIGAGYTSSDRLAIQGGSAGGMLVGGVVNMRPELFRAAVAQVPFVDVVNTMLDAKLPLTTSEYIEWGNPNDLEPFEYMLRYSPYDNIRAQPYPAMLVKVALHDSQVPYWEGAKFVAKLRAFKTDDRPVLLKVNVAAGHGGASGRYDALREGAFTWAFVLWQLGLAAAHPPREDAGRPGVEPADANAAEELQTLQERGTKSSSNNDTA
jgi:oligopeptidase B